MKFVPLILSCILSLTMFIGGIILLLSQIPFWSLFLGIAATQIGIVFLIFTYEKLSRENVLNAISEDFTNDPNFKNKPVLKK